MTNMKSYIYLVLLFVLHNLGTQAQQTIIVNDINFFL